MFVKCAFCNHDHDLTPTRMTEVIAAFQRGEMQRITGKGLESQCLNTASGAIRRDRSAGKMNTTPVAFSE